ncbi:MAG TPA: hypothetical protein VFM37_14815, partial [Pseudonocardiaceae bacterium]|nr:hypothetical protein [Pseudonocardiaceae bacterium]
TRLDEDPRFRAVTERWRQCMRQLGFDERDPRRLAEELPAGADPGGQPLARADLDCKSRTGYLSTGYARLAEIQRRRLDEDPSVAVDWTDLLARQDTIARAVLR